MEWARVVVEGFAGRINDPVAFEEVAKRSVWRWDSGWGLREERGIEGKKEESEED